MTANNSGGVGAKTEVNPIARVGEFDMKPECFNEYKVVPRLLFGKYLQAQFELLLLTAKKAGIETAVLYDTAINRKPERWTHTPAENWVPFTVKLISDVHSFTLIETDERKLTLKQLDAKGVVLDEIVVTK